LYRNVQYLLAKAECDFEAPLQFRSPVEVLQSIHAGLSVAAAGIAVAEYGLQGHFAAVVVVTEVQGKMTCTLEAEVSGQLSFWFRTCRGRGQRILHATTARTQEPHDQVSTVWDTTRLFFMALSIATQYG
jgi:hypothetical protein